ncbi:unnamed protein product, partial [Rotaria magnacalcarata]
NMAVQNNSNNNIPPALPFQVFVVFLQQQQQIQQMQQQIQQQNSADRGIRRRGLGLAGVRDRGGSGEVVVVGGGDKKVSTRRATH